MTRSLLFGGGLLLLALVGCSQLTFVYSRIDWLAPFYVDDYVALDRAQNKLLKRELVELRDWHCQTQLASYAHWARTLEDDIRFQHLTPERVAMRYSEVREALRALTMAASPAMAQLVSTLSPRQQDQLFDRLGRENAEFAATYVDVPLHQAQRAYAERMQKQVSEWLGALTPAQQQRVVAWGEQVAPGAADRLQARRAWQIELRQLLEQRHHPAFAHELQRLVAHPDRFKPERYQEIRDDYRHAVLSLLSDIAADVTPRQRQRLLARAGGWRRDFERLACAPGPGSTRVDESSRPLGGTDGLSKIFPRDFVWHPGNDEP